MTCPSGKANICTPDRPKSRTCFIVELYQVEEEWGLEGLRHTVLPLRGFPFGGEAEMHI